MGGKGGLEWAGQGSVRLPARLHNRGQKNNIIYNWGIAPSPGVLFSYKKELPYYRGGKLKTKRGKSSKKRKNFKGFYKKDPHQGVNEGQRKRKLKPRRINLGRPYDLKRIITPPELPSP